MQTLVPADDAINQSVREDDLNVQVEMEPAKVEALGRARVPLRKWPADVAELYREEVVRRLYREEHFLFLLGLLVCLTTIAIDLLVQPSLAEQGAVLRVLAIAPITFLGLIAGARHWTQVLAFCVGAAPIAFIAVIAHLGTQMPADIAPRYFTATILLVGIGNIILPYSMRGLVIFDLAALTAFAGVLAAWGQFYQNVDTLVVFAIVGAATLPVASRFEKLRQSNFLLTLRARLIGQELAEANSSLIVLSETDPLTGIANRRRFERDFEKAIFAPGEHGRAADKIAIMMIDLDHFKQFNDTHGHQSGDYCLQLVANTLRELLEDAGGIAARYGGEEFIAAVRTDSLSNILDLAEAARLAIAATLNTVNESERALVTASIGVGVAPAGALLPREELIEMADAALYGCKKNGRNRVEVVEAEKAF